MRRIGILAACLAVLLVAGVAVRLLFPLPSLEGRTQSRALSGRGTTLDRSLGPALDAHPGRSGIHLLKDGRDAFAARVSLARSAERSIDAQYYIWHDDLTGALLFDELRAAAERGVRVRLLLDDNNTSGLDAVLAALDAQPNIEVRLFNPFTVRWPRLLGWAVDFGRLNHRMHNKSFTVDGQATIIGGRNVGDEYFGAGSGALFVDLDALAVGPVVADVGEDFDRYWASASAYPARTILSRSALRNPVDIRARARSLAEQPAAAAYLDAIPGPPVVRQIAAGQLSFAWAPVQLISDDPAKALGQAGPGELLITRLRELLAPHRKLGLVSGYFVPTGTGARTLSDLAAGGTAVSIVTNSYEATDVPIVHAGYAGYRRTLLEAGIRLWEIRAGSAASARRSALGSGGSGVPGSSGQALHAKTFTADGERLFVGSFNLDPRSARLNTELGFIIRSPELTARAEHEIASALPREAYELRLAKDGRILWIEHLSDRTVSHEVEPGTTRLNRAFVRLASKLPIEWLL